MSYDDEDNEYLMIINLDNQTVINPTNITGNVSVNSLSAEEHLAHNGMTLKLIAKLGIQCPACTKVIEMLSKDYKSPEYFNLQVIPFDLDVDGLIQTESIGAFDTHSKKNKHSLSLRYVVEATLTTTDGGTLVRENEFKVVIYPPAVPNNPRLTLTSEVDHPCFVKAVFEKTHYTLSDVIKGKLLYNFSDPDLYSDVETLQLDLYQTVTGLEVVMEKGKPLTFGTQYVDFIGGTVDRFFLDVDISSLDPDVTYKTDVSFDLKALALRPNKTIIPSYKDVFATFTVEYDLRLTAVKGEDADEDIVFDIQDLFLYRSID